MTDSTHAPSHHIVVMGVSGAGKTTVGETLAAKLGLPFYDGDDFHPQSSIDKMAQGIPLTDEDRWPWLRKVGQWLHENPSGGVIGCSSLKRSYRDVIREGAPDVVFVHVHGDYQLLLERMDSRTGHFMVSSLLKSQFEALEPLGKDEKGKVFDVSAPVEDIVTSAVEWLEEAID